MVWRSQAQGNGAYSPRRLLKSGVVGDDMQDSFYARHEILREIIIESWASCMGARAEDVCHIRQASKEEGASLESA